LIGRLTGSIVEEGEGGVLVVDVAGVGYEVLAPLGTRGRLDALPDGAPSPVTLYVHTHVREDALQLFGFATIAERDAFRIIIGISNVGPKLGLSILGAVSVGELAIAVLRGDGGKLTAIPGVGKKTAERLVLELKGKLDVPASAPAPKRPTPGAGAKPSGHAELLAGALTRMGYRAQEAERAIAALASDRDLDAVPLGDLVREALSALAK
jgi:Holliday junction DNA helicase RuvA